MVCSNTSDNQTILRAGHISYSLGELARSAVPQLSNKAACQAEQFGGQLRVGSPAQHDRCKEEDSHNFSWLMNAARDVTGGRMHLRPTCLLDKLSIIEYVYQSYVTSVFFYS